MPAVQRAPLGGWAVGMGGSGYSSSSLACPTPEDMDPSPWSQKPGLLRVSYLPDTCQSSLGSCCISQLTKARLSWSAMVTTWYLRPAVDEWTMVMSTGCLAVTPGGRALLVKDCGLQATLFNLGRMKKLGGEPKLLPLMFHHLTMYFEYWKLRGTSETVMAL